VRIVHCGARRYGRIGPRHLTGPRSLQRSIGLIARRLVAVDPARGMTPGRPAAVVFAAIVWLVHVP